MNVFFNSESQISYVKDSLPLIKRNPLIWINPKPLVSTPAFTTRARTENDYNFSLMRAELGLCGSREREREDRWLVVYSTQQ